MQNASDVINDVLNNNQTNTLYLKIDCEGSEFEIFNSFGNYLPKQIKGVLMEWHFKEPLDIIDLLLKNSFKLVKFNLNTKSLTGLIYAFR
jgi:hypothetical protein